MTADLSSPSSSLPFAPFDIRVPFEGWGEEKENGVVGLTVTVANLPRQFASPTGAQRTSFAKKLVSNHPALGQEASYAIAHSMADPVRAGKLLAAGAVTERHAGNSALEILTAPVVTGSLFILEQPRGADTPATLKRPKVYGKLDESGNPLPVSIYEFESFEDVHRYTARSIAVTLSSGYDLRSSILAEQVNNPILVGAVEIHITGEPGSGQPRRVVQGLTVLDGITRVTMSLASAYGGEYSRAELPNSLADLILKGVGEDDPLKVSAASRKGRAENLTMVMNEIRTALGSSENPVPVRFGQTVFTPANVVVGFRRLGNPWSGASRRYEFIDGLRSVVGQEHTLSRAWTDTAVQANVGSQALDRATADGNFPLAMCDIALGREDYVPTVTFTVTPVLAAVTSGADEESDGAASSGAAVHEETLDPGLARGVAIIQAITQPSAERAIKKHIRALVGKSRLAPDEYLAYFASIIWDPWGAYKKESHPNEATVWRSGYTPIPHSLVSEDKSWTALFPRRWTDLVPIAADDNNPDQHNARVTLQVAGALALVADGQLLAPSGANASVKTLTGEIINYTRVAPHQMVTKLAGSTEGLWILAHAADSFRSRARARNAFSKSDAVDVDETRTYLIALPASAEEPHKSADSRDGKTMSSSYIRDFLGMRVKGDGATGGGNGSGGGKGGGRPAATPERLLGDYRTNLSDGIEKLAKAVESLDNLIASNPELVALDDFYCWQDMVNDMLTVQGQLARWRPVPQTIVPDDDDVDDYADSPVDGGVA